MACHLNNFDEVIFAVPFQENQRQIFGTEQHWTGKTNLRPK